MTVVVEGTNTVVDVIPNRCVRFKSDGQQCGNRPMSGTTICWHHGGSAPQIQRKALVRATLKDWGLSDEKVDPGETLLRLVSQSARRASFYGELLRQAYEAAEQAGEENPFELPRGVAALIEKQFRSSDDGKSIYAGEAIRALVKLESDERKLCADFSSKAINAGLAERAVRVAEAQGAAIIGAIMVALDRAGVVGPARLDAQNAAADYLLEVGG